MVIRRVDVTDIVWVFAVNELPYHLSKEDVLITCHHYITTKCSGKPQTIWESVPGNSNYPATVMQLGGNR